MLDLFNDIKKNSKPGPKMNVRFIESFIYHLRILYVSYGTTIDELLKYYLRRMNRTEFIGSHDKIRFYFKGIQIKFGDQTPVETYFKHNFFPEIKVYQPAFSCNWNNWTKEGNGTNRKGTNRKGRKKN